MLHLQQRLRGQLQAAVPRGLGQPDDGLRVPQASRLSLQDHLLQRLAALHFHQRVQEAQSEWVESDELNGGIFFLPEYPCSPGLWVSQVVELT